jgi:uncharacterized protein (DUF305 family)
VVALVAVAAIGACSNSAKEVAQSPAPTALASSVATPAPATHNQADTMFAHMMIPHHQQAIQMSDVILGKQGIDARVVDLATQIKAAQGPEIQQMQGWLNQWGTPGMTGMPGMNGMPGMGEMPGTGDVPGMEGMMSPADMQALQNTQGAEASKLFLTQMIKHHQGAIAMAQNEIKNGQFPDEVAMAKSIASSQQKEIDTMNQILSSL